MGLVQLGSDHQAARSLLAAPTSQIFRNWRQEVVVGGVRGRSSKRLWNPNINGYSDKPRTGTVLLQENHHHLWILRGGASAILRASTTPFVEHTRIPAGMWPPTCAVSALIHWHGALAPHDCGLCPPLTHAGSNPACVDCKGGANGRRTDRRSARGGS